jgi:hypothetical protein
MSVDSYFPGPPDIRMKENPGVTGALGIRYEGPVLSGKMGVRQAFRKQASELCGPRESSLPPLGSGVKFAPASLLPQPPNAADRLLSVDPVMAGQRAEFGRPPSTTYVHPEQYDAVLRSHLHMKPAPDPYEAQRRREAHWQSIRDQHVVK